MAEIRVASLPTMYEPWKAIIAALSPVGLEATITCLFAALRPRKRDGLLGTGTEWEGDERVKARPRKPPEKDRRDRGPPPEQRKC